MVHDPKLWTNLNDPAAADFDGLLEQIGAPDWQGSRRCDPLALFAIYMDYYVPATQARRSLRFFLFSPFAGRRQSTTK
jgi:hypothetical protein